MSKSASACQYRAFVSWQSRKLLLLLNEADCTGLAGYGAAFLTRKRLTSNTWRDMPPLSTNVPLGGKADIHAFCHPAHVYAGAALDSVPANGVR
jgi:hypothetical protein